MAQIIINEISQNYTYNIGTNEYAIVAMPITSSWGPYLDLVNAPTGSNIEDVLERVKWDRFPATQSGLESFVAQYRGTSSCYKLAKDYSYQMAMTLLSAGYDILACRICSGSKAKGQITVSGKPFSVTAKYAGTFGNSLLVVVKSVPNKDNVNVITYVVDASGIKTAVENIMCTTSSEHITDSILYIEDIESKFLDFKAGGTGSTDTSVKLSGGTDLPYAEDSKTSAEFLTSAVHWADIRYKSAGYTTTDTLQYMVALNALKPSEGQPDIVDKLTAQMIEYRELTFYQAMQGYDLLKDKLTYNHNRIISPGWDDQDFEFLTGEQVSRISEVSPIHIKLLDCAYNSRCATAFLDIPKSLIRSGVYNESEDTAKVGYAQLVSRYMPPSDITITGSLYSSHSALFAPWGQYKYVGTSRQSPCTPAFQALMIQRAMILNQSVQYEWALPTNRKHNLKLGKLDYNVPKKLLDEWQSLEGVGVNVITTIPDLGTTLWGNSTLFEVPPATYQALANLSTRFLVNAVESTVIKCGISITYRYNNDDAYNAFYAGVTPLLDTMKNVGAIDGYAVKMSTDIDGFDSVNLNTVIGQIFITIRGVINDIKVDLIALPAGTDLGTYQ